MLPKPFPYNLGVGVDLVEVLRVKSILEENSKLNKWAQRVFNRLEWPFISRAFQNNASRPPRLVLRDTEGGFRLCNHLAGRFVLHTFTPAVYKVQFGH